MLRAAVGDCDLSVLHIDGEWQWLVRRDGSLFRLVPEPQFPKSQYDYASSMYFSIITMATVGYGDIYPISETARWYVCSEVLCGVLFTVVVFAILTSRMSYTISGEQGAALPVKRDPPRPAA